MFNPSKGCRCSAINCNVYSDISEYQFHRFQSNKEK